MIVDDQVALEVACHEALIRQTYRDSKRVLTWCVGMTNATGHRVERYIGKPASLQHCMNLYAWALTNYSEQVKEAFRDKPLTQAQFAAALSFHWNTGAIKRATWVRYWLRGDVANARKAFMNWVTPTSIAKRRAKERDLFFDGVWSNNGSMLEYTRVTASMSPDWKSGRRINVAEELAIAFGSVQPEVEMDQAPQPDAVPAGPTLTPKEDGEADMSETVEPVPGDLSPIDQTNKANKGAGGAGLGAGGIGGGIVYLWSLTASFPAEWANDPQAMIILTGMSATAFGAAGAWIGAYLARDRRFQPA